MRARFLRACSLLLVLLLLPPASFASAYNARPKLIVIIVIDQFRGDMLERLEQLCGALVPPKHLTAAMERRAARGRATK